MNATADDVKEMNETEREQARREAGLTTGGE